MKSKFNKSIGIIPARYGSKRFPGKPLADIAGKSMIMRVFEGAKKSKKLDRVIVATDDTRIFNHVLRNSGEAMMTSNKHQSGTDRCGEVIERLADNDIKYIVNIQGDEPLVQANQVDTLITILEQNTDAKIATLVHNIQNNYLVDDANVVKVAMNSSGQGLYFSRSKIPYFRNSKGESYFKHIGMYGYEADTLLRLVRLEPGILERAESLEQLRWLENGYNIYCGISKVDSFGVDVPEDINRILSIKDWQK